ncbi:MULTISPECIES: RadC family protein [Sphingobium]|uniref:DNA repair protein RadC n=2 Tax=Sphingobium cupriresistens TaxID=1132417 RepID=A0A0J7Y2A5_9SPHN|nr:MULTISPECIES: DNA repair protein RadC [Sphingobium]KMS57852.1 DNA repair protein RadC [Sphingobium cupriresistens LL01]MBJ7376758.1 DNA repair protein RadC [Sphingobium sp.]RYM06610.1 DNA repair protein RadC [Sphingobium cupriresistens]
MSEQDGKAPHDGAGHRARLRSKLAESGGDGLHDHELIEYLLALAIPRRDTKPLAKALLREFGGIGGLMSADWQAIARLPGMGDTSIAAIKIVQATMLRALRNEVAARPVLASWQALLDYLRADMAHLSVERVRVLHLNSRNMLIRDDHMGDGSIDQAAIYVREVIKRAMELGSAALILVHNHPSGDPSPSRQDIDITRQIVEAGKRLGISVHDHIIMAASGHASLRAQGLL